MRVWVVDDEPAILQVMETALNNAGHTVKTFANGARLRQTAVQGRSSLPDLMLIDAVLNGESGLEIAEMLQSDALPAVRMVIMSGDSEIAKQVPLSMQWLRKPFRLDQLLKLVDGRDAT